MIEKEKNTIKKVKKEKLETLPAPQPPQPQLQPDMSVDINTDAGFDARFPDFKPFIQFVKDNVCPPGGNTLLTGIKVDDKFCAFESILTYNFFTSMAPPNFTFSLFKNSTKDANHPFLQVMKNVYKKK